MIKKANNFVKNWPSNSNLWSYKTVFLFLWMTENKMSLQFLDVDIILRMHAQSKLYIMLLCVVINIITLLSTVA